MERTREQSMQARSSLLLLNLEVAEDELPPEQGSDSTGNISQRKPSWLYRILRNRNTRLRLIQSISFPYSCLYLSPSLSALPSIIASAYPLS